MTGFKDHFSTNSDRYAQFRPTYPKALAEQLAKLSPSTETALDIGCGTGQLTALLADYFDQVIGVDASENQIKHATRKPNVSYRVGRAEEVGVDKQDKWVDVVTVAQAAHWLNLEEFYANLRSVLKPQAVVALISYGVCHVEGVDEHVQHFYHEQVGPYWPPERRLVESGYRDLPFPYEEVDFPQLSITEDWSLDQLMGYFSTWSAVKAHDKDTGIDAVAHLRATLEPLWGEGTRRITSPLALRVGRA